MVVIEGEAALMRRLNAIKQPMPILRKIQLDTIFEAKALVPRKTGFLGRSIIPGPLTQMSAEVDANANYAAYVERGTRPHIIRAKPGKTLAWGGDRRLSGRLRSGSSPTHFAKVVHHPGTKPHPYLLPGAVKAVSRAGLADAVIKLWNGAA